jgi:hypothetical protein
MLTGLLLILSSAPLVEAASSPAPTAAPAISAATAALSVSAAPAATVELSAAPTALAQEAEKPQGDREFSSAEAGFKIKVPAEEWAMQTAPGEHGISALGMGPPALGGLVQLTVQVLSTTATDLAGMAAARDALLKQVESIDGIRNAVKIEMEIAGMTVPGLELEQDAQGQTYFVRQAYLLSQGLQYKFQFHAPKDQFADHEKNFQAAVASFEVVALAGEAVHQAKLRELANRCGSEVEIYDNWDTVSAAARAEKKLIVVSVQAIPGFEIGDQVKRGVFMDLDIVKLMNHRFKALQWRRGMGAPFEEQDRFGMGPSTFGTGMLVVTPDGDVVRQIFLLEAAAVYDVLIDVLRGHPQIFTPKPPADADRWHTIEFLLRSGQVDAARTLLEEREGDDVSAEEWWLRFEYYRLMRRGDQAMRALMKVQANESMLNGPVSEARASMGFVGLFAVTGDPALAAEHLTQILKWPDLPKEIARELPSDLHAEALLMKGALSLQAKDRAGCEEAWLELTAKFPETRWAWMVAGWMTGPGWKVDVWPDLRWPEAKDKRYAFMPKPASAKVIKNTDQLINGAARFLLASQLSDGSWTSLTSYNDRKELADDFELASTAICGRALLRMPNNARAQAAAERALNWLIQQREVLNREESPPVVFMDYTVWSRSYCVYFLAECLEQNIGDAEAVRAEIKNCLKDLADRQQGNGGWSYYLSTQVGGEAAAQSISFTSATVVMAWEKAKAVGVEIDEEILNRGLACMEALRSENHTFAYFLNGADIETSTQASAGIEGSAARGPSCALSLVRGGRENWEQMVPRFELYIQKLSIFGDQHHKALMHAGPAAQGSHYLLYDYSTGAEALREGWDHLPKDLRKTARNTIMRELRRCLNADGSFIDNPLMGTDTCTGMALATLLDLKELK